MANLIERVKRKIVKWQNRHMDEHMMNMGYKHIYYDLYWNELYTYEAKNKAQGKETKQKIYAKFKSLKYVFKRKLGNWNVQKMKLVYFK